MIEQFCCGYDNVQKLEAKSQKIVGIMRELGKPATASEISKRYKFTEYNNPQAVTQILRKLIKAGVVKRKEIIIDEKEVEVDSNGRFNNVLIADEIVDNNIVSKYHWEMRATKKKVPIKRIEFSLVSAD